MPLENRRTPLKFKAAQWLCTLPKEADGSQGLGFLLKDGSKVRLFLDAKSVQDVLQTLAPGYFAEVNARLAEANAKGLNDWDPSQPAGSTATQSPGSSLMPSEAKSVPSEGVKQPPEAASSIA